MTSAASPDISDTNLVWMDLEMTGLDVERDRILEIAVIVTDQKLGSSLRDRSSPSTRARRYSQAWMTGTGSTIQPQGLSRE